MATKRRQAVKYLVDKPAGRTSQHNTVSAARAAAARGCTAKKESLIWKLDGHLHGEPDYKLYEKVPCKRRGKRPLKKWHCVTLPKGRKCFATKAAAKRIDRRSPIYTVSSRLNPTKLKGR